MHVHMLDHMDVGFKPLGESFYRTPTMPTRPLLNGAISQHMAGLAARTRAARRRALTIPYCEDRPAQEADSTGTPRLPIDQRDLERVQVRAIAVPPHFYRPTGVVEGDSGDREDRRPLVDLEGRCLLLRCGSGADRLLRDAEGNPFGSKDLIQAVLLQVLPRSEERRVGKECREGGGPCGGEGERMSGERGRE